MKRRRSGERRRLAWDWTDMLTQAGGFVVLLLALALIAAGVMVLFVVPFLNFLVLLISTLAYG